MGLGLIESTVCARASWQIVAGLDGSSYSVSELTSSLCSCQLDICSGVRWWSTSESALVGSGQSVVDWCVQLSPSQLAACRRRCLSQSVVLIRHLDRMALNVRVTPQMVSNCSDNWYMNQFADYIHVKWQVVFESGSMLDLGPMVMVGGNSDRFLSSPASSTPLASNLGFIVLLVFISK